VDVRQPEMEEEKDQGDHPPTPTVCYGLFGAVFMMTAISHTMEAHKALGRLKAGSWGAMVPPDAPQANPVGVNSCDIRPPAQRVTSTLLWRFDHSGGLRRHEIPTSPPKRSPHIIPTYRSYQKRRRPPTVRRGLFYSYSVQTKAELASILGRSCRT
jgi:hypothetical protein